MTHESVAAPRTVRVPFFERERRAGSNFLPDCGRRTVEKVIDARNRWSERRSRTELLKAPKKLPKTFQGSFQYFSRTTPEDMALRANCVNLIGKRRSDCPCGGT